MAQVGFGKVHELLKDPMLEKLVLLVVSMFSVATETRLEGFKDLRKSAAQIDKQSEPWHSHSLECASYYLPKDCPLVDHLIESYYKHYVDTVDTIVHPTMIVRLSGIEKTTRQEFKPSSIKRKDDKLMRVRPEFKPIIEPPREQALVPNFDDTPGFLSKALHGIKQKKRCIELSKPKMPVKIAR